MMRILVDADAYIGAYFDKDAHHLTAQNLFKSFSGKADWYVTSDVVDEVATKLSYTLGKSTANKFLETLISTNTKIIYNDEDVLKESIKTFMGIKSKRVSLTDCTNIVVYKNEDFDAIFSFDKIYAKFGLNYLK